MGVIFIQDNCQSSEVGRAATGWEQLDRIGGFGSLSKCDYRIGYSVSYILCQASYLDGAGYMLRSRWTYVLASLLGVAEQAQISTACSLGLKSGRNAYQVLWPDRDTSYLKRRAQLLGRLSAQVLLG